MHTQHTTLSLVHNVREGKNKKKIEDYIFSIDPKTWWPINIVHPGLFKRNFMPFVPITSRTMNCFSRGIVRFYLERYLDITGHQVALIRSYLFFSRCNFEWCVFEVYLFIVNYCNRAWYWPIAERSFRPPLSLFPKCLECGECFKDIINKRIMIVNIFCVTLMWLKETKHCKELNKAYILHLPASKFLERLGS